MKINAAGYALLNPSGLNPREHSEHTIAKSISKWT
jgi:hypothetical protein